ncbi:MAG: DUF721 domain-containing protein [Nitrosomonas sp.]|nr:DUF721 domain-containing protein [Nitrosomonas sp.]
MTSHKVKAYLSKLGQTAEYQEIFSRVNQLNKMQKTFLTLVPPYLAQSCNLGKISNGKLTVLAENGAIASKLKLISPSLLLQLQKLGWNVTAIQVSVQAHYYAKKSAELIKKEQSLKKPTLSQTGIESLDQLALSLPNSELKNSIQSLLLKYKKNQ